MAHYYTLNETSMRELEELSVDALGVVRKNSATAMSDTSKILVVGLGGMGLSTVHELKKTLISRIGKLRESDIQFLAFDTSEEDISSKRNAGPLTIAETRLLISPSLASIMDQSEELRPNAFRDPMPPKAAGYNPTFDGQGAGQVRLTGRLSIMDTNTYHDIIEDLKNAITRLGNFTTRKLEIHVICGIGGGTGSGLCVDMPYIIRHVADLLHIPDSNRRLFGHVYLPNTYDTVQNVNLPKAYRNGYAALKEIDYYMNINSIYETFDAVYPDGRYSTTKPIFDFCTLIGGHISAAIVIDDTKGAAINTCVDNLVNQVTHTVSRNNSYDQSSKNSSLADIFTSSAFLSNVNSGLSTVMSRGNCNFHEGGNYKYTYIGSSTLKFPTESIIEYFTGEVFTKTLDMLKNNASLLKQTDVDAFEKAVVSPLDLIKPYLDKYDALVENIFGNQVWNKATVATKDVDIALTAMINNVVKGFDEKSDCISNACAKAGTKASAIFKDPAKGPYFLARLIKANSTEGGGVIGFYEKLDNYAKVCNDNIDKLSDALRKNKEQKEKLAETMQRFGHFNSNLESYKNLLRTIWKDELKVKLYQKLSSDYYLPANNRIGVCYQLRNTLDNAYIAHADILTRIGEIMAVNAKSQEAEIFDDSSDGSIFCLTDSVFDALKNSVRHSVKAKLRDFEEQDVIHFAGALLNDILSKSDNWSLHGINPLESAPAAVALRDFIYNYEAFSDITGKTFTDYFEDAYRNETDAQKDRIVRCIADYLDTNASPMCNVSATFSWVDVKELCHRFMIIPNNMGDSWGNMFTEYLKRDNQNILMSPDQNAIYNYTLYASMPIWIHGDLAKYEKSYYDSRDPGVHINESIALDPPYTEYPPLMAPKQWHRAKQGNIEYVNNHEIKFVDNLNALINKAKDSGVICRNDQDYFVVELLERYPTAEELEKFFKEYTIDRTNYSTEGLLLGGVTLRKAMKEKFGSRVLEIYQIRTIKADVENNLPELIRRQMKLIGKIKNEIKYITENVDTYVDEFNKGVIKLIRRKNIFVFMLYGLIDADERGMWKYHLGDNSYNIVSKIDILTDMNNSVFAKYMEIAVCNRFYELEKADAHLVLLNNRKNTINLTVFDNPAVFDTIKLNYAKYSEKASQIVESFNNKVLSGNTLTNQELEIKEFYEQMLKDVSDIMSAFSAD